VNILIKFQDNICEVNMVNLYGKNNKNLESWSIILSLIFHQFDFSRIILIASCFYSECVTFLENSCANTRSLVFLLTVPRRWMVPLFMCWADTRDKIQGEVVLSNLQESTPISMVECIQNYIFLICIINFH